MVFLASIIQTMFVVAISFFIALAIPPQGRIAPIVVKPPIIEAKGIYLTAHTAGNPIRREQLIAMIKETGMNSVVIDVKDYTGRIFYDTKLVAVEEIGAEDVQIPDLQTWLAALKEQGIYTIARIVVFQDPQLANAKTEIALKSKTGSLWRDWKGVVWVDPTQQYVWEYNLAIAKEVATLGFDEINFDYIRFPSDGDISSIMYADLENPTAENKSKVMAEFYEYVDSQLRFAPVATSADLFGMVLWREDGMNIGQRLQDAAPYFDYISPMVYPSHFPDGFQGFSNPADYPYEIIYRSLQRREEMLRGTQALIRPWLQDFDIGAIYNQEMIDAQIQATKDGGGYGWLLWNARNVYEMEKLTN